MSENVEQTEVKRVGANEQVQPETALASNTITPSFLEQLAQNQDISPEKLKQFMDLRDREEAKLAKRAFMAAMARVQEQIPVVVKDCHNAQTNSKYASEEAIARAIKPIYTAEGFSLSFDTVEAKREGHMRAICIVRHEEGHEETRTMEFPYDSAGIKGTTNKTPIHAYKSTFTYLKSTLTCAVFNVATGKEADDDGNGAFPNGVPQTISEQDQTNIEKLIKDTGTNRKKFIHWLEEQGIDGVENIPADKVPWVTKMIVDSASQRQAREKRRAAS